MKYLKYLITYLLFFAFLAGLGYVIFVLKKNGLSILAISAFSLYFINSITLLWVFIQTRHSGAKLSWILVMGLFPFAGHILFAIFGQRYKSRLEIEKYRKRYTFNFEKLNNSGLSNVLSDNENIFEKQSYVSKRGVYKCDFEVYKNGSEGYKSLFADLRSAKKFIHLHYYIIKKGEIYDEFKSILIQKASEGVEVRFIIDDFGHWAMPWYEIKMLKQNGIQIKIFGKVRFPFIGSANGYRTHRKLAIIDGTAVHTGGLNIADEYANLNPKYGLWVDFQTKIVGEAVRSYSLLFIQDWYQLSKLKLNPAKYLFEQNGGKSTSLLIEDSPEIKVPILQNSIVKMILNAKNEINITTPYLIPTTQVFSALRMACLAGVKVNIFIPGKADKKTVILATRYYANILQKLGASIFESTNMIMHAKVALFDNSYAYLGTANLDTRSLYSQFEIMNLVSGKVIMDIKELLNYYKSLSKKVPKNKYNQSKIKNIFLRLYVNLFSPIM